MTFPGSGVRLSPLAIAIITTIVIRISIIICITSIIIIIIAIIMIIISIILLLVLHSYYIDLTLLLHSVRQLRIFFR